MTRPAQLCQQCWCFLFFLFVRYKFHGIVQLAVKDSANFFHWFQRNITVISQACGYIRTVTGLLLQVGNRNIFIYQAELTEFIDTAKEQRLNTDSFLGMVRKYTDITELSAEIIRSFVERIKVLQPEKVSGTRTKKQTIVIYWNFIGAVEIPDEQEKTT